MLSTVKFFREIYTLLLLFLFFCFHFGYAPFYPAMFLSSEKADMIQRFDVATILLSLFFIVRYFVLEIDKSEEALAVSADKLEGLIGGMLPKTVLNRIREEGKTFADHFDDCSVLFADIVSFTSWSEKHTPYEIVVHLNAVFSKFDVAVEKRKLTKIKTIGDAYLVVAGVPDYRDDHAVVLTELALELQQIVAEYGEFEFRAGINSGSVVAGIIGKKTFQFDIWGDTVNVASRIESLGNPGKVTIGNATYEKIKHQLNCRYTGKFMAKNKGEIDLYEVE
jgi:class 3 adenylate cyclase